MEAVVLSVSMSAPAGTPPKLAFSAGRYYVDGILCETDGGDYASQPHHRPAPPKLMRPVRPEVRPRPMVVSVNRIPLKLGCVDTAVR